MSYQTSFQDFMDSNNHQLPSDSSYISQCVCLIDMRWCLHLKSTQNNLAWNGLILRDQLPGFSQRHSIDERSDQLQFSHYAGQLLSNFRQARKPWILLPSEQTQPAVGRTSTGTLIPLLPYIYIGSSACSLLHSSREGTLQCMGTDIAPPIP